ncbi:MAG TPA: hypothetical protein VMK84_09280 [Streptosporangiaceae bacterium]|nr:hypothetical protein [Streptosporangiaceae bacterium]
MAQASGTRTQTEHDPAPRRRRRGREVVGLVVGIVAGVAVVLGWMISTRGQPPRPVVYSSHPPVLVRGASGASAEPDPAALDAEWAAYSNRSSCADWAGGDGVSAIRLNSSQLAWFFSDTYLGPAGPAIGFSHLSGFLHNSVVVQTSTGPGSTFVTLTGGGACTGLNGQAGRGDAAPVVGVPPTGNSVPADRYWEEDGLKTGDTVVKFYHHYLGGTVPYVPDGTVIASFGVSQLSSAGQARQFGGVARPALITLPSYTPPAGGSPILWGASLLRAGSTVYVYGTQSPKLSAPGRVLYLARVPLARLTTFSAWQFYAGGGRWAAGQDGARPVQAGADASSGFSVVQAGHRYWLIQAATAAVAPDIDAYPAAAPWGPFDFTAGRLLYRDPAIGLDAAHDYRILYEARAEPALSTRNTLVISYNVNSEAVTTGCVPMSAFTNTLTLPRFVAVPMTAFGHGATVQANTAQARGGPPGYPQIVQQNPSQWFDAWEYQDGCPPVPALASVRARPGTGRVTLSWPDAGLRLRYHVYLQGPGQPGGAPVRITQKTGATITGLQPGDYQATVVPVNFKEQTGRAAKVTFTVP